MSIWEWMAVVGVMGLLAFLAVAIVVLVYQLQNVIERMDAAMELHEAEKVGGVLHVRGRGLPSKYNFDSADALYNELIEAEKRGDL